MASKKTLNAKNLEALGAERLAELLLEMAGGDAAAKRRLRLELAGAQGAGEVAREVRKRLASLAGARGFVDWRKARGLIDDLYAQRRAIVDGVAKSDPAVALDLMWRYMELADVTLGRVDDSNGKFGHVFRSATGELGAIATAARADPVTLADRAFLALTDNGFGQYDGLIADLAPALGEVGLAHLKERIAALSEHRVPTPPEQEREVVGWSSRAPIYADEVAELSREMIVRSALKDIADAQGDVDAFMSQYDEAARKVPKIAVEIASRLLAAGRAEEAWRRLEEADRPRREWHWLDIEWDDARIETLDALGRTEEAQATRLEVFEDALSASHLREYLKRLADFDDVEAEERALDHVAGSERVPHALMFLIEWPALDRAARLVTARADELNGDHYEFLRPAAETLAAGHPLAATLLFRSMIDFTLSKARSTRYRHAARHLMACESLAGGIEDFGNFESHEAYAARLRDAHGRKSAFWRLLS